MKRRDIDDYPDADDMPTTEEMKAMRAKMLEEAMKKRRKTGGKFGKRPPHDDHDDASVTA